MWSGLPTNSPGQLGWALGKLWSRVRRGCKAPLALGGFPQGDPGQALAVLRTPGAGSARSLTHKHDLKPDAALTGDPCVTLMGTRLSTLGQTLRGRAQSGACASCRQWRAAFPSQL